MARKKKVKSLPSHIELISGTKGRVREFTFAHALSILRSEQGTWELFNQHLYKYEDGHITFNESTPTGSGTEHELNGAE
jgi:hypothetical protein